MYVHVQLLCRKAEIDMLSRSYFLHRLAVQAFNYKTCLHFRMVSCRYMYMCTNIQDPYCPDHVNSFSMYTAK